MKFAIITHVQHIKNDNFYFGYAPYIREMNIWLQYVDEVIVVAPLVNKDLNPIHEQYRHSNLCFRSVSEFNITSVSNVFKALFKLPKVFSTVYSSMSQADHIHLRCPGNMGLIGAMVQILFPKKPKTAKYAGNWDPNAKQPFTYKLQRWILSNTFLTKNMQVLVYGDWEDQTKNIKSFFTATYSESDKKVIQPKTLEGCIDFLFVGTLSKGKQPLLAIQLVEKLYQQGKKVRLNLYGDGILRPTLETYIEENNLQDIIFLRGNQSKETVLKVYQTSHFLVLPSKSEGWPKVVAEAMFWACVPVVSKVSCVPYMLGYGERGIQLEEQLQTDISQVMSVLNDQLLYQKMASEGQNWSRQFTTDKFEIEIKKLLQNRFNHY
ncbi:MAG: glycosyl transferase [Flavobacteria bacterium GWF1_32_7]|nr:MAG: glycosyl transferase [Flavobacteria bacterium GWF1_32_7]